MIQQSEIDSIRNILTLRYDPTEKGPIPHKKWTDYTPTESDPQGKLTEARLGLAIRRKIQDYSEIAISLSSGVDSSLVLALIRKYFPKEKLKILALHYCGTNNQEEESSRRLANKFDCEFYAIHPKSVFDNIEKMFKMMDAPKWDVYDFIIPRIARLEGYNLLVTGDGSDELYAGYTFRLQKYEEFLLGRDNIPLNDKIGYYLKCHQNDFVEDQIDLFGFDFRFNKDIFPYFEESFNNPLHPLQQCMLADFNGKLVHNFLIKKEKFNQEFNIESWSPFLDEQIINYATHLPLKQLYKNGIGKLPLRAICKRLGLDPPMKKLGFTHDIKSEWRNNSTKYLEPILNKEALIYQTEIINQDWTRKHQTELSDERIINKLVSLYTLEKYLQWKHPEG